MEAKMRNGFFNPRRFGHLLLRELAGSYRAMLIAMAAVGGAVIVASALSLLGIAQARGPAGAPGNFYLSYFFNLLFLGGFIVTSLSFREVWQNGGGIFYLTLPGSVFEKLVGKLLVTSVGFALGSMIFMAVVGAVSEGINTLLFGFGHGFADSGAQIVAALKAAGFYVITQSVFFLGAIWFKKLPFLKTVLWIVIFGVGAGIVAFAAARIFLASQFVWTAHGWSMNMNTNQLNSLFGPGTRPGAVIDGFKIVAQVLFYAMAPVCWLAYYFRLGEAEV